MLLPTITCRVHLYGTSFHHSCNLSSLLPHILQGLPLNTLPLVLLLNQMVPIQSHGSSDLHKMKTYLMAVLKIECLPIFLIFILFIDFEGNWNRVKILFARSSATCFKEPLNVDYPNPKQMPLAIRWDNRLAIHLLDVLRSMAGDVSQSTNPRPHSFSLAVRISSFELSHP